MVYTARDLESDALELTYDETLHALREGVIDDELGVMRWGSNHTFLVNVTCDNLRFLAIYKPRLGERPLWDFPDGTLCQRETAAFVLSEALGWHLVPPTVLREGPHGVGSVQVFILHDPNRHYFTFDERFEEQLRRLSAFDVLNNNADRKGGHCLVDQTERLWGIDHGLTFHSMNKLRTVIWDYAGTPFSADILEDFVELCGKIEDEDEPHAAELKTLLSPRELRALHIRLQDAVESGLYPLPGPGPNRPWPAI